MATERSALVERYRTVLDGDESILGESFNKINNKRIEEITAVVLENTIQSIKNGEQDIRHQLTENTSALNTTSVAGWTGVLVKLVRRGIPQLCAHELVGVQPMDGPTGLVFAQYATYANKAAPNNVALFGLPDTAYSGFSSDGTDGWDQGTGVAPDGTGPNPGGPVATDYELDPFAAAGYTTGTAMDTATGEGCIIPKISLTIESVTVSAKTRALCTSYSSEVAQDMQRLHGLDAEAELAREMANELVAEINAEIMRTIIRVAKIGAEDTTVPGTFDLAVDSSGRYFEERLRDLVFRIEIEANKIAFETYAGKGNVILTTANVASALSMMGVLSACCDKEESMDVNAPLSCYAGMLNGKYKVFVDPYQNQMDYVVVGLKQSDTNAGLYYTPYVPFAVDKGKADCNGHTQLFFRSRYGMVSNPFVKNPGTGVKDGETLEPNINPYYRKFAVRNLTA